MNRDRVKRMLPPVALATLKKGLHLYKKHFKKDAHYLEVARWHSENTSTDRRMTYPLNQDSVVFDIGGYTGNFANSISERYGCHVYLFEPISKYYEACVARFKGNKKIKCFNFAVASYDGEFQITHENDGSTMLKDKKSKFVETVKVKSLTQFILDNKIEKIDLAEINIEGGEFDLLPDLIEKNQIAKFINLQIQFHDFVEGARQKREVIRKQLSKTHDEIWTYPFVWEAWKLKSEVRVSIVAQETDSPVENG